MPKIEIAPEVFPGAMAGWLIKLAMRADFA
jgi:hypothetical protein